MGRVFRSMPEVAVAGSAPSIIAVIAVIAAPSVVRSIPGIISGKVSRGDMIIGINNKVVKNPGELVEEIKKYSIGDKVDISVQSVLLKKVISVKLRELN